MSASAPELEGRRKLNPHPLQERESLLSAVRLLDVANFQTLARPLPRSQDLPEEYFGAPSCSDDQVISVSHAWRNQAHPDPTCDKIRQLGPILSQISSASKRNLRQRQSFFLFLDFISIPQRPFCAGQEQRTPEEIQVFKRALECMHEMYFYSDRIIHLPWEDVDVPGEGLEVTIPAEALQGSAFSELGEAVQIAPRQDTHAPEAGSERGPKLFDEVVSVDGRTVKSSKHLESLLASDSQIVKVRRYPFGKYSEIPADRRGWVFLERFITMVKCAMMDEDTAKHVVITPSEAIFKQIMHGADVLRKASLQEKRHSKRGELRRVLERFNKELQGKEFSAASTDKRELSRSVSKIDDRSVVHSIMQGFVTYLAEHWEREAAEQRSLGSRLTAVAAVAQTYLVEWECFSEEYTTELVAASTVNPWPVVVVILVPLVVTGLPLLWPYESPDASWDSQGGFWGIGLPSMALPCIMCFAEFLAKTGKIRHSRRTLLLHVMWAALNLTIVYSACLTVTTNWQIFPIPVVSVIGAASVGITLPALFWVAPPNQRTSRQFQVRVAVSMAGLLIILGLYGLAIPMLNTAIPAVSDAWQPVLVSCYMVLKLAFEFLGLKISKVLGADAMPHFILVATYVYQLNLCIAFSKVNSWFLVVEQISFDVLENSYHLYSLFRQDSAERGSARREQYIVASLALREFVEIVAPASFLLLHELIRAFRRENFALFCGRSEQEVQRTVHFLAAAISAELVGSCATYVILRYRRHSPLLLLRGLASTLLDNFVLIATTSLTYYCAMQHSHWGMDLTFGFPWIVEPESDWQCGLTWANPEGA